MSFFIFTFVAELSNYYSIIMTRKLWLLLMAWVMLMPFAEVYDLMGRKVSGTARKGVYIVSKIKIVK